MFARITKLRVLPGKLNEFSAAIDSLRPAARKQNGYRGVLVLRAGEDGPDVTLISIWDSLQDLRASESNMYYFEVISRLFACCEGYPLMHEEEVLLNEVAPRKAQSA
jgi:quinol monooxygenase YgiN